MEPPEFDTMQATIWLKKEKTKNLVKQKDSQIILSLLE